MFARLACAAISAFAFASPALAGAKQQEWAVLLASTQIYMHPDPSAALPKSKFGGAGYVTFRKVSDLPSGWAEVETVYDGNDERESHDDYDFRGIRIRLFVRSDTFVPVLLKRMKVRLTNGRSHVFLPGTPVEPGAKPDLQVARYAGGGSAAVPAAAVGRVYKAAPYSIPKPRLRDATLHSIFDHSSALGNHLPAQTRLYWGDGSEAGYLVNDQIPDCEVAKRPCFHQRIGGFEALLCGAETALDGVGAAMKATFQQPPTPPP